MLASIAARLKAVTFSAALFGNRAAMRIVLKARFRRKRHNSRFEVPGNSAFFPYGTSDCEALFFSLSSLCSAQRGEKPSAKTLDNFKNNPTFQVHSNRKYEWSEKIEVLRELYPEPDLWRGAIDSYKSACRPSEFFDRCPLDSAVLEKIRLDHLAGLEAGLRHRLIMLTDLGYIRNRSMVQAARSSGARIFVVNPFGFFEEIDLNPNFAVADVYARLSKAQIDSLMEGRLGQTDPELLLAERLRGLSIDWNVRPPYSDPNEETPEDSGSVETTLFLHATRDAANYDPTTCSVECQDSLTWSLRAIETLLDEKISFEIRRHPSAPSYRDEIWIFDQLVERYKLGTDSICSRPSLSAIAHSRCVTTLAGTVTLEAVARGRIALNFASLFPPSVGQQVSFDGFADAVRNSDGRTPDPDAAAWARAALTLLELPRLRGLRIERPMVPGLKGREFLRQDLLSGWGMTVKLMSRKGHRELLGAAVDVIDGGPAS